VLKILEYLPAKDLVALSKTCRYFDRIVKIENLWKALCLRENAKRVHKSWRVSYAKSKAPKPAKKEWQINNNNNVVAQEIPAI